MKIKTTFCVVITLSMFVVLGISGCRDCPECPPCDDHKQQIKTDKNASVNEDVQESDAGMEAAAIGGKPKEVTAYKLHGRAGFDKVSIWTAPDMDSPRLGYMRKGQRTMLGDPEYSSQGCPKGWYNLPNGGFVCQGRGMLVGTKPRYIHHPPPPARVDELDPYRHGFIRSDWTPLYKRIPTLEEMWTPPTREVVDTDNPVEVPDGGEPPTEVIPPCTPQNEANDENEDVECTDYARYTKRKFRAVRQLLSRGFWVSVSRRFRDSETREYYYETIKGGYVPGNAVHLVRPPKFQGYQVLGDSPLPAAIVKSKSAAFYERRNGKFRGIGPVQRLSVYRVLEESDGKKTKFYKIEGERWLKSSQVVYFPLREKLPEGVGPNEKWILVDLSRQSLEAYDGHTPAYVTLVSTGLPDSEETVTPNGRFHITFKHVSDDMVGSIGDNEDVYSVADVPWVQYIHRNIALHASFWHSRYGKPKSHGCVNLSPADARFLFDWSLPAMPKGWHGVSSTEEAPGTLVIIEGKTPE